MKANYRNYYIKVSLLFITLLASGCYYDQVAPVVVELPDTPLSYATDIQPIWETKGCLNCHSSGATAPDLTAAVSYNEIVPSKIDLANPEQSKIYTVLDGFMAGTISAQDKAVILKWLEQGAQNN